MNDRPEENVLDVARRLNERVLSPLKRSFVGKDEVLDLLGIALIAGENLFLYGPPGTAKSALVRSVAERIDATSFEYLLTRFTEPNEVFGPFDIRRLREGELVTNTANMLPEADLVFLDELLNANSAILNSLLTVLNERRLRRGRETLDLPVLSVIGASNRLPEDETLGALFDRFLVRVRCDNVEGDRLDEVLSAGWALERRTARGTQPTVSIDELRAAQSALTTVELNPVRPEFGRCVARIRQAGIAVSDRRAVKLQRLVAASALMCGRTEARRDDLWVLRYTWETAEQEQVLAGLIAAELADVDETSSETHPLARRGDRPNAEHIAAELDQMLERVAAGLDARERVSAIDRLALLEARCEWIENEVSRTQLLERTAALWTQLGSGFRPPSSDANV
ncbi:MAG: AAA family ATPase [Planctomycetota bacterium]